MIVKYGEQLNLPTRVAVRGVIRRGNEIGIIKVRKYDCFIFPGGGVDEGEDLVTALKREMLEEAGFHVEVKDLILTTETSEADFIHQNHYFECEIISEANEIDLTEIEIELGIEFIWCNISELYDYYINYEDDLRFGDRNMIVQRSIKSRGFMLLTKFFANDILYFKLIKKWIGKEVMVKIDRPIGFVDKFGGTYQLNYGFIEKIYALDGEELDAYVIGPNEAVDTFKGKVIGVIYRDDDIEEKLVVASYNCSSDFIMEKVNFIEKHFKSTLVR